MGGNKNFEFDFRVLGLQLWEYYARKGRRHNTTCRRLCDSGCVQVVASLQRFWFHFNQCNPSMVLQYSLSIFEL